MTKLIPAEKLEALPTYFQYDDGYLTKDQNPFGQYVKLADLRALIDAEPDQQAEIERVTEQRDRLLAGLTKISEFCPYDKEFNQLDAHPINQIRGTIAEVGDTARALIAEIEAGK